MQGQWQRILAPVKATQGERFQIGNNRGRINGWVSRNSTMVAVSASPISLQVNGVCGAGGKNILPHHFLAPIFLPIINSASLYRIDFFH